MYVILHVRMCVYVFISASGGGSVARGAVSISCLLLLLFNGSARALAACVEIIYVMQLRGGCRAGGNVSDGGGGREVSGENVTRTRPTGCCYVIIIWRQSRPFTSLYVRVCMCTCTVCTRGNEPASRYFYYYHHGPSMVRRYKGDRNR